MGTRIMNDFKKEELEYMSACVYFEERSHYREQDIPQKSINLLEKIQSMIDNYCEHEYEEKSVDLHAKQCCKCQEVKVL